jgi:hypothetical protein
MQRHLLDPVGEGPVEAVVGRLGAIEAQADQSSELSVGIRRAASAPGDVAAAFADGRLVKAFAFRGGRHLMTPEDAAVYLRLRAASRQWELRSWQSFYDLKASDWPAFRGAVRDALARGPLTLKQLGAAVVGDPRYKHLGAFFPSNAWTLIKALMWQGDMCFAPSIGGQPTFQRLDAIPRWPGLPDLDEAGRRAITAYLSTYGPATLDHLQYWLGAGLSAGRKRINDWFAGLGAGGRLAEVEVGGELAVVLREDVDELLAARSTAAVRLLPAYDQWVMGPGTADPKVVPVARRALVSSGANVALVGGVVAGTWTLKGDVVGIDWFEPRKAGASAAVADEIKRLGRVLGRPVSADG